MQAHHKIADLRIQKNLTLQALAERVGTTKSQIDKLEKGERRLTVEWLQRIAHALGVPVASFFTASPDPRPPHTLYDAATTVYDAHAPHDHPMSPVIPAHETAPAALLPVYGRGDTLTDSLIQLDKVVSHIARPPILAGVSDAYAVYMVGDSMEPRYFAGELLYIDPSRPLTRGCFVILIGHDDTALVRRLVRRNDGGTLVVQEANGSGSEDCLSLAHLRAIHRIVGTLETNTSLNG